MAHAYILFALWISYLLSVTSTIVLAMRNHYLRFEDETNDEDGGDDAGGQEQGPPPPAHVSARDARIIRRNTHPKKAEAETESEGGDEMSTHGSFGGFQGDGSRETDFTYFRYEGQSTPEEGTSGDEAGGLSPYSKEAKRQRKIHVKVMSE
jgi:hypothetical protein